MLKSSLEDLLHDVVYSFWSSFKHEDLVMWFEALDKTMHEGQIVKLPVIIPDMFIHQMWQVNKTIMLVFVKILSERACRNVFVWNHTNTLWGQQWEKTLGLSSGSWKSEFYFNAYML